MQYPRHLIRNVKIFLSLGLVGLSALPGAAAEFAETQPADYQIAESQDLPIRVQVVSHTSATSLRGSGDSQVKGLTAMGWRDLGHLPPSTQMVVRTAGNGLKIDGMQNQEAYRALRLESPDSRSTVLAGQSWYRGHLILTAGNGGFSIVNEVPLEAYLYSVVPSEMPASWPLEALKSQAVAARTYALVHLGGYRQRGYDVTADTSSQVYQGVKAENTNSSRAVSETNGLILTYNGQPIQAYFHSCSGGRTENGADLWAPLPYLQPVDDVDQASPRYTWHEEQSQAVVTARLKSQLNVQVGKILALQPQSYTSGGRVKTLRVLGTSGEQTVAGEKLRMALGLNSTFFNVGSVGSDGKLLKQINRDQPPVSFEFAGRGWGHGMGLSQWGARQLALDGYPYQSILTHYYRGVRLERLNPARYQVAMRP